MSSPACCTRAGQARGLRTPDYPWAWTSEQWDAYLDSVDRLWGTQEMADDLVRGWYSACVGDAAFRSSFASFLRAAASPGAALVFEGLQRDTDIRDVLATIQVPVLVTQRTGVEVAPVEEGRYVAANIPGARLLELDGTDFNPFTGDH